LPVGSENPEILVSCISKVPVSEELLIEDVERRVVIKRFTALWTERVIKITGYFLAARAASTVALF